MLSAQDSAPAGDMATNIRNSDNQNGRQVMVNAGSLEYCIRILCHGQRIGASLARRRLGTRAATLIRICIDYTNCRSRSVASRAALCKTLEPVWDLHVTAQPQGPGLAFFRSTAAS